MEQAILCYKEMLKSWTISPKSTQEIFRFRKLEAKTNGIVTMMPKEQQIDFAQTMIAEGLMDPQVMELLTIYPKGRITRL